MTPEQDALRSSFLRYLCGLFVSEDELKPKPTNAELAAKYAVSTRTVTNWRKEGCPFDESQWSVLDWMAERRYVPATARAKFARQLERRNQPLSGWTAYRATAMIARMAKLGLLPAARH